MRLRRTGIWSWGVVVDDFRVRAAEQNIVLGLGGLACLGGSGALLSGKVVFRESLFAGLGLPVVIADAAATLNDAAAKLAEHGAGRDNGNLAGAVAKGKNLLLDKVVLFGLASNDFEERPVLVKQQIRISVAENPGTLGGEHEELVAAVGH